MRFNRSDPGLHGILIAIGFAILGMIALPGYWLFLVGATFLGVAIACVLRFIRKTEKNPSGLFPLDLSSQPEAPSERVDTHERRPNHQLLRALPSL
jgi:hypothetical protein